MRDVQGDAEDGPHGGLGELRYVQDESEAGTSDRNEAVVPVCHFGGERSSRCLCEVRLDSGHPDAVSDRFKGPWWWILWTGPTR